MKSTWSPDKQTLVAGGYAHTVHDQLPFFGGRKIRDTGSSEIASLLIDANIEGASHNNGRIRNLELYAAHLDSIGKAAADTAVKQFLQGKSV